MGAPILERALRARPGILAVLAMCTALACESEPFDPDAPELGPLRVLPVVVSAVDPDELELGTIEVTIRRVVDDVAIVDTTMAYEPDAVLAWLLALEDLPSTLRVTAIVSSGATVMFAGSAVVDVDASEPSVQVEVREVDLAFVGPGHDAVALTLTPDDSLVMFGDSVPLRAHAVNAGGVDIPDAVVVWSSSEPERAPIERSGVLRAPDARDTVTVTGRTPGGLIATADVRVQAPPASLEVIDGSGDSAVVASSVPLSVRVLGADGLAVEGVPVDFSAPDGATLSRLVVASAPDGMARVEATLGTVAGEYAFGATAGAGATASIVVQGLPGPAAALGFREPPARTEVTVPFARPLVVDIRDAWGNTVAGEIDVTLELGSNPGGASLVGTTSAGSTGGAVTFEGVSLDRSGAGYTLIARGGSLLVESNPFDVVQIPRGITLAADEHGFDALGGRFRMEATVVDAAGDSIEAYPIAWSSSETAVATVNRNGVVVSVGNGSADVLATAGSESATARIVVEQVAATIELTVPDTAFDALGPAARIDARVLDGNRHALPEAVVTWESDHPLIVAVDSGGALTALRSGNARITARSGDVHRNLRVRVRQRAVLVEASADSIGFDALGIQASLSAIGRDANGVAIPQSQIVWSVEDTTIARIRESGVVTARGNGSTRAIASAHGLADTVVIAVAQVARSIELSRADAALHALDATVRFDAVARDGNGRRIRAASAIWQSDDPTVAEVDDRGLVRARANGSTRIRAVVDAAAAEAVVLVEQRAATIDATVAADTLTAFAERVALSALVRDANGYALPDQAVLWSSADPAVLSIDGVEAVAVGNGRAVVRARRDDATDSVVVNVEQRVAVLVATPATVSLAALEQEVALAAEAQDANGFEVADPFVAWHSEAPSIVAVDGAGVATALANGSATLIAEADDARVTVMVTVEQIPVRVDVTPAADTLIALGASLPLAARVVDANGFDMAADDVVWSSSDAAVVDVDAVGVVTARRNGSARLTATAGLVAGHADVTVAQRVAALVVTPGDAVLASLADTIRLGVEASDANGFIVPDARASWVSEQPSIASVDSGGLVTAHTNGAATLRGSSDGVTADAIIVVEQVAARIEASGQPALLASLGDSARLIAAVVDANGFPLPDQSVSWTSSHASILAVDGAYAVALANGSAFARASRGSLADSTQVVVDQRADSLTVALDCALESDGEPCSLGAFGTQTRGSVAAFDANGHALEQPIDVSWSSSDPEVLEVDAEGLATARSNGSALLSATVDDLTASAEVVVAQRVATLAIEPGAAALAAIADTIRLRIDARDANGFVVADAIATWSSANEPVATVDADGVVTAHANGTATVSASNGGVTAAVIVEVEQLAASIEATAEPALLTALGDSATLAATILDANGFALPDQSVTWTSSDATVLAIEGAHAVAFGNGEALAYASRGSLIGSASVVVAQRADSLALTIECAPEQGAIAPEQGAIALVVGPPGSGLCSLDAIGAQARASVAVFDANGHAIEHAIVRFASDRPDIATVDSTGVITATGNGLALITATSGDAQASSEVRVQQVAVTLEVEPDSMFLRVGETAQATAVATDRNGHLIGGAAVIWTATNRNIAAVSATGLVTGAGPGFSGVDASIDGLSAQIKVTVAGE